MGLFKGQARAIVGMCPNCSNIVAVMKQVLIVECEACGQSYPLRQGISTLESACTAPGSVDDIIALCLQLEEEVDILVPLGIMAVLKQPHPYNEQVAFIYTRMGGYAPQDIKGYLETFAAISGEKPWALEFLERAMQPRNMHHFSLFKVFIDNKIPPNKQKECHARLNFFKDEYTSGVGEGDGVPSMYVFYTIGALINIGLFVLFVAVDMRLIFNTLIAMGAFTAEIGFLFVHNKMYGNRLNMNRRELMFLCIFLSSIAVAVAGVLIGALV